MTTHGAADLLILGNVNVDLILGPLQQWPAEGQEVLVPTLQWRVGGNAGNAALACHALGLDARTVTPVGQDLAGQWLRAQLPAPAVVWLDCAAPTSVTAAFSHPGSERSFITYLGHLEHVTWRDLRPHLPRVRAALLAGAFLTPQLRAAYPELLRHLNAHHVPVALDFGWPDTGFTAAVQAEVLSWLPGVQHLLINELEATSLTGEPDVTAAAAALAAQMPPSAVVAIKRGADGVLAFHRGQLSVVHAPRVEVVDSVGAGDTWNAAYLQAVLRGQPLQAALQHAVAVASHAISTRPRHFLTQDAAPRTEEEPARPAVRAPGR
ncbi:carbohydrate kinase family protein [Deinococcus radiotolerans]|uniref:Carbohydrate kinase n=1 Tax=Deinococcus radiotolerans TaxID=1309407 RepID=A0ABQ2FNE1_9DEIO|nr:carbohydrate kinase family protein [Deinococcus radiotolerans]GGL11065.1 carbohydrate kinase [Deinococcus radiotolerans]